MVCTNIACGKVYFCCSVINKSVVLGNSVISRAIGAAYFKPAVNIKQRVFGIKLTNTGVEKVDLSFAADSSYRRARSLGAQNIVGSVVILIFSGF